MLITVVISSGMLLLQNVAQSPGLPPERGDSALSGSTLLEVRIGNLVAATMHAQRVGDTVRLPVSEVLALAEFRSAATRSQLLTADSIAIILHAAVTVDWDELTATFVDDGSLPVSRRHARRMRGSRATGARGQLNMHSAVDTPHSIARTMRGLFVDYSISQATYGFRTRRAATSVALGTTMFGGTLDADLVAPAAGRAIATVAWRREWPDAPLIRALSIGDPLRAASAMFHEGISLSTRSLSRSGGARSIDITGSFPAGWEIEAYRDGVPIYTGAVDAHGAYAFELPASVGANPITITAFGSRDSAVSTVRYLNVPEETFPRGTQVYDVFVGRCRAATCDYGASVSALYAPASNVTLGGGFDVQHGARTVIVRPAAMLAIRWGDALNAHFRRSELGSRLQLRYTPTTQLDVSALIARENAAPAVLSSASLGAVWRWTGGGFATAALNLHRTRFDTYRSVRLDAWLPLGALVVRPLMRLTARGAGPVLKFDPPLPGAVIELAPIGLFRAARIRLAFNESTRADRSIRLASSGPRESQLEFGVERSSLSRFNRLTASLSTPLRLGRYYARSAMQSSELSTDQSITGSLALSDETALRVSATPNARRGTACLTGVLFVDSNANGVRDTEEKAIPYVGVQVADASVETDSAGRYSMQAEPFSTIVVRADAEALESDDLIAAALTVRPLPNAITRVDIPARVKSRAPVDDVGDKSGLPQNTEGRNTPSVHGHDFESGISNPHPVTYAGQMPEARKYIAAQGRPISLGDFKVIVRPSVHE